MKSESGRYTATVFGELIHTGIQASTPGTLQTGFADSKGSVAELGLSKTYQELAGEQRQSYAEAADRLVILMLTCAGNDMFADPRDLPSLRLHLALTLPPSVQKSGLTELLDGEFNDNFVEAAGKIDWNMEDKILGLGALAVRHPVSGQTFSVLSCFPHVGPTVNFPGVTDLEIRGLGALNRVVAITGQATALQTALLEGDSYPRPAPDLDRRWHDIIADYDNFYNSV